MLVCHCNIISQKEIEDVILGFLRDDAWQLLVPTKVYRELGKRGRCCGCFPNVVDIIVEVTEKYHLQMGADSERLTKVQADLERLQQRHRPLRPVGGINERRSAGHRAA